MTDMFNSLSILLLVTTIVLSTTRNLLSKNISGVGFNEKKFFVYQAIIFLSGGAILISTFNALPSFQTVYLALGYAAFLLLAQWCYTIALSNVPLSVCSTVYSLGFIIPTVLGAIIYHESVGVTDIIGLVLVVAAIFVSGYNKKGANGNGGKKYFIALIVAMLASGGLGLMQKVQQNLPYASERNLFVTVAFIVAGLISVLVAAIKKPAVTNSGEVATNTRGYIFAAITGVCFAACNLLNTILAGRLPSAIFFPLLNISNIVLSVIMSAIINKEKPTVKSYIILLLGIAAIILLSV